MLRQYKLKDYRFSLIIWVAALSVLGIMIIGSAQESSQSRQLYGLIMGLILMVIVSLLDYTWLLSFTWIYYLVGLMLLVAVLFLGVNVGGATRWINIGIRFQPSDIVKIILVLFFADFFSKREDHLNTWKTILFSLILLGIPLFLIYKEPDLSTTIVTALTFCAIIFVAGLSYKIIGGILLVTVPVAVVLFSIILRPGQTLIAEYQLNRILSWLRPEEFPDLARQQQNSIIAIGSGQLYGKGLNNNMVSSVKNGNFIAEPQTDFIFAVAGSGRKSDLLWDGRADRFSEFYQHLCCNRAYAQYRDPASFCQLRNDLTGQLLYWTWDRIKHWPADSKILREECLNENRIHIARCKEKADAELLHCLSGNTN